MKILRYFKYLVLIVLALGIVTLSLANRGPMTLQLLPADLAAFVGYNRTIELPVFLVILLGVATGLLIGFIWEWLREHRHRAEAARARAEAKRLESQIAREKRPAKREGEDVLALLESKPGSQAAR
jgi:uncharacterized integral membrane protein